MQRYRINEATFDIPDDWHCETTHVLERDVEDGLSLLLRCTPCTDPDSQHFVKEQPSHLRQQLCSFHIDREGRSRRQLSCTHDDQHLVIVATGHANAQEVCDRLVNAVARTVSFHVPSPEHAPDRSTQQ